MNKTYVQFNEPSINNQVKEDGPIKRFFKKTLIGALKTIIPLANPDFDNKIPEVKYWLVECDSNGVPEREIGLNEEEQVILKMPFGKNYGYWTDNNLLLNDFKERFGASEINKEYFEQKWKQLDEIEIK